nr:GlcNAc-1-P transferase [Paratrimastix eleionoma]
MTFLFEYPLLLSVFLSFVAYFTVLRMIPKVAPLLAKAGLGGIDLNKKKQENPKKIPESLGIVTAGVYITVVIIFECFQSDTSLLEYHTSLLAVTFMILLGFADDVLALRWRDKIVLSAVAALPLAVFYTGPTAVHVPIFLRDHLGEIVELGVFYKIYVWLLAIFCTNSINIYAGINGLEVSQSIVIACAIVLHNLHQIYVQDVFLTENFFSLTITLPFIACSLALLKFNKYPSRVFVGDSYTYFAGMMLAVAGTLGHFSKTLMLFFGPQIFNFVLSLPQLFHIIPCPRHRLPIYDDKTGKLRYSPNLTLINAVLYLTGPMHEHTLLIVLSALQALWCLCSFGIRYLIATWIYPAPLHE